MSLDALAYKRFGRLTHGNGLDVHLARLIRLLGDISLP